MDPRILITDDGSQTVFDSSINERYHSTFGAVTESLHVFIESGLRSFSHFDNPFRILEVGFGTGLNALLTLIETDRQGIMVHYDALEPFPLEEKIYSSLRYPEYLERPDLCDEFLKMHRAVPDNQVLITKSYSFTKISRELQDLNCTGSFYHLVYFDAFSPEVQPELWCAEHFQKLYDSLKDGGILVTYCSKGDVKRSLAKAGFHVERLPGPPGKRHMLRARK